jgi:hypothetical protein
MNRLAMAKITLVPEDIRQLGDTNPLVRLILDRFISGDIVTLEECLCQIIVHLCANWDQLQRRSFEQAMSMTLPPKPEI